MENYIIALIPVVFMGIALYLSTSKLFLLKEQNRLYQEFVKNTPFKKFLKILGKTSIKAIDLPMRLMLEKYFSKALTNVNLHLIPKFLIDIKNSKHAEVLQKEFAVAVVGFENILGLSLTMVDKDGMVVICQFIDGYLPEESRKLQYECATRQLEYNLENKYYDHPLDFKKEIKDQIAEFSEKAK